MQLYPDTVRLVCAKSCEETLLDNAIVLRNTCKVSIDVLNHFHPCPSSLLFFLQGRKQRQTKDEKKERPSNPGHRSKKKTSK